LGFHNRNGCLDWILVHWTARAQGVLALVERSKEEVFSMTIMLQSVLQGFGLGIGFFVAWHALQFTVGLFEGKKADK